MRTFGNLSLLLLFLAALSFGFLACDDCSDTADAPVTAPIRFSIVNPKGENLVDTNGSYYSVDSIGLFDQQVNEWIYLNKEYVPAAKGYVFSGDCAKNKNGKSSLILKLTSFDSDTLDVWYKQEDNKCFLLYAYTHFQHNGRDLQKSPLTSALLISKSD
ncbi:hypothetical protein MUK70_04745 [Dyadobacter chenwenxiniae]|uniref:Uncharacterized protein n=1 Tax=Dyadobacter chenwenxiniae TaxID=2906456 RepID=A0A9X1THD2_9BACT|nr:hypothetical protein [Dyadobacter chenwenxiniae]MCF0064645.1 hypothetical protein [Dyadobacter chenwenxiniae]UON84300.1 hypothetical protein MUK70_04745 [Dyadobacter chenwenxiniae]